MSEPTESKVKRYTLVSMNAQKRAFINCQCGQCLVAYDISMDLKVNVNMQQYTHTLGAEEQRGRCSRCGIRHDIPVSEIWALFPNSELRNSLERTSENYKKC